MTAVARIYRPNGGGSKKNNDSANVPLIVERVPVVPLQQGVEAFSPEDDGTLRNRLGLEYESYDFRVYALTLVQNGPNYEAVIQHVMQENAEQFSIKTGQVAPTAVDTGATLPYTRPQQEFGMSPDLEAI